MHQAGMGKAADWGRQQGNRGDLAAGSSGDLPPVGRTARTGRASGERVNSPLTAASHSYVPNVRASYVKECSDEKVRSSLIRPDTDSLGRISDPVIEFGIFGFASRKRNSGADSFSTGANFA